MNTPSTPTDRSAYALGLTCLCHIEATRSPSLIDALADVSPDLGRLAIRFVYGEIYQRPHLSYHDRQLATVAVLAVLGNARPQLKFHIAAALNVGCSAAKIVELMTHLLVYAGFPTALNGVFAAKEVFDERQLHFTPTTTPSCPGDARYQAGMDALSRIDGHAGEAVMASLKGIAPDLGRFIVEFGFGEIYTRPVLELLERELITVAALAALGTATPQLRVHIHGLLNVGGTREQMLELAIHVAAYAGFPAAINATLAAREVFSERDAGGGDGDPSAPSG
ncbi:carboxymuconolactone decarboxylase family protein [Verminephrobacter aporrectodeae subsp. tuberculatae]|uniref:Carboxymuconolactone decarboxylase family protein n=1 Tax=Verminephrobacter aporrectodeae subsp. tuberculatae TaxID=1110392 RepID=A0ABT3KSY2_9BURK|nr:carboxymuconolactone decarboxylase family protein [Verminephrobacter aporrectodeae]MCW5321406.1 carboxymuconolactone decarboxylase family protein [Verminephrobacter aporrectodeae subsp. tuberculatae]MCW8207104.1 carboxymuconolactone decarboxylase family protein [Verminephrobacter aporrectodeae subsp. tuberculatae]